MKLIELEKIVQSVDINLSEKEILNYLLISKRWPFRYPWGQPSVEILCENEHLESKDFFDINSFFNFEKWIKYYDLGFTTIISNVLDLNSDLRKLNERLTDQTGLLINGNFYLSKPGRRASFEKHNHPYDVIVKQIYGTSQWIVDEKEIFLKPKDTCIIPKNVYHQVINKNENKLSLTINIE